MNKTLNNIDFFKQIFILNISKEFEAHKSMMCNAISFLSKQFAESFKLINQCLTEKFKSLNKNLATNTESLHDKFDDIQSKPSNDDEICHQIIDKISEEQKIFINKFSPIDGNQEILEVRKNWRTN